jgi:hypothetical protein
MEEYLLQERLQGTTSLPGRVVANANATSRYPGLRYTEFHRQDDMPLPPGSTSIPVAALCSANLAWTCPPAWLQSCWVFLAYISDVGTHQPYWELLSHYLPYVFTSLANLPRSCSLQLVQMRKSGQYDLFARLLDLAGEEHLVQDRIHLPSVRLDRPICFAHPPCKS